jgi:hypothetical protein
LLAHASAAFAGSSEKPGGAESPNPKELHAKIGQRALEIDFSGRRARTTPRTERITMIDRDRRLPLCRQTELLKLSRALIHCRPVPVVGADPVLMRRMDELYLELPFAGCWRDNVVVERFWIELRVRAGR